ncbi:MAG: MotA/TolQ/ExbB proton channel family protein [candidate division Zixibacteria bacterium]|nr:MotA/TolQ/ExbB proton channel family protein [candidate division Zixibacteria bacterium]MDH3938604.1 MotA/TolQ/ExbB proton channel family protein [candidate division Zixibacteria bacterium]MDH4033897.1 MotA/TolQ/ExbB proton channel family protein [candidate division Zixibacteria bacterium]
MKTVISIGFFSGSVWQIIGETSAFGIFVLICLTFMSLVSWLIIINKWRQFRVVEKAGLGFLRSFDRSSKLADSIGQAKAHSLSPLSSIFMTGYRELDELRQARNQGGQLQASRQPLATEDFDVIEMAMEKTLNEEIGVLEQRVIFLATTASAAPFMGLLGTVVGIMDSFWSIGEIGSASLAVVAPGIAEALLATIVGLGAAIPAVIAYNWANNRIKFQNKYADSFILAFMVRARKEEP